MMNISLRRIVLIVSYDGTNFAGWQRQTSDCTIQQTMEEAAFRIVSEDIKIMGSGRTDAGVHAKAQVASFTCSNHSIPAHKFSNAFNKVLPKEIRIIRSFEISLDFDPRRSANRRIYSYRLANHQDIHPLHRHCIAPSHQQLDFIKLNKLASLFVGYHDFTAFCSIKDINNDKRRFIYRSAFTMENNLFVFHIEGNAFLMGMVRFIVGTILFLQDTIDAEDIIKEALSSGSKKMLGPKAKACGLTLEAVKYSNEWACYDL